MSLSKRILLFFTAAILFLSLPFSVTSSSEPLSLKNTSVLTLDRDGSGYVRGIWGIPTASSIADEFSNTDLTFLSFDGRSLSGSDRLGSDSTVCSGEESLPILIYGDVDRNARIDLADIICILKYIANWDIDICTDAADIAINGKCELTDAVVLLKWLAGWDVSLGDSVFPATSFSLKDFYVVKPEDSDFFEDEAAKLISNALISIYGSGCGKIVTDSTIPTNQILVGSTARHRTDEAKKKLSDFGWSYSVPTSETVVIVGDDSIATYEAAEAFLWDVFGYVDSYNRLSSYYRWNGTGYDVISSSTEVTTGLSHTDIYTPSSAPLCFIGRDCSEYSIVSTAADSPAALLLQRNILRETGNILTVSTVSDSIDLPAIRLGVARADGTSFGGVSSGTFVLAADGDNVVIDVKNASSAVFAVRAFSEWYIEKRYELNADTFRIVGMDSNLLDQTTRLDTAIDNGVTYSHISYTDRHSLPVEAYLTTVENGASRIVMGTENNTSETINTKATVLQAITAAEASGKDIVCGINADFFHIESDYRPNGLCVKDGVILKQNDEARPWIAVMKNGKMDCGTSGEARKKISEMQQGFGASHVLLYRGLVLQDGRGTSFGGIRHPRTALGYDDNGTVYLLVVDGRNSAYSNGASLIDLAVMLKELGAVNAVNLDGGGSSTMIIDDGGSFNIVNSPCDGSLRAVYNSILITKSNAD